MIDHKLLKRIQAMLALTTDRGATQHEADTAQKLAKRLMEKYKIDPQDIPKEQSRARYVPPRAQYRRPRQPPPRQPPPRRGPYRPPPSGQREYARRQQNREWGHFAHDFGQERDPLDPIQYATSKRSTWKGRLLNSIGLALGYAVGRFSDEGSIIWTVYSYANPGFAGSKPYPSFGMVRTLHQHLITYLKRECVAAKRAYAPSNPNAFNRAFYEEAVYVIHSRLAANCGTPPPHIRFKSKNPDGRAEGKQAGMRASLYPIA